MKNTKSTTDTGTKVKETRKRGVKSTKDITDTKTKGTSSRAKVTFRIYTIDRTLPREIIQDSIDLNTEDIFPEIYILLLESREVNNIDKFYDKHEKKLSISDIVELQNKEGISKFYFLGLFGFEQVDFEKNLIGSSERA